MRNTSLSVLLTHCSPVPCTGRYAGAPVNRMSSAGCVLTKTFGTAVAATALPGRFALTSFQLSSAGSFEKLAGSLPAGDHVPFTSVAVSHVSLLRRYNAFVGAYWNKSQF